MSAKTYDGPVVFVDGVHYAVDEEGHADTARPLRWVEGSTYRDADEGEPLHNEVHQINGVEVTFPDDEAIVVSPDEADAVKELLAQRRGAES